MTHQSGPRDSNEPTEARRTTVDAMRARLIRAFLSELQREEVLEHCEPDDLIEVTAQVLIIAANGARLSLDDLLESVCSEFNRMHLDS